MVRVTLKKLISFGKMGLIIMAKNKIKNYILLGILLFVTPTVFSQGYGIKRIVIDAGHGGKDPGATGKRSKEKDIALKVALFTGNYIEENLKDVEVFYTRKKDVYVDLMKRAQIAHEVDADLFISIHVDAVGSKSVHGPSTYVLGLHRTDDNLRAAQKENAVIKLEEDYEDKYEGFDPGKPESYIIFNFVQNAFLEQSTELANTIQTEFRTRAGRRDRGVHQAGFLVLRETSMPSVLVELGYITNADEEAFLNTTQGQEYMASAIYRAVRDYKKSIENRNHATIASESKTIVPSYQPQPLEETTPTATIEEQNPAVVEKATVVAVPLKEEEKKETTPLVKEETVTLPAPIPQEPAPEADVVIYKLQIMASTSKIPEGDANIRNLDDLGIYSENGYFKYTLGESEDINEIKSIRAKVKNRFPDAFIIAFKNGQKLSISEYRKLNQ